MPTFTGGHCRRNAVESRIRQDKVKAAPAGYWLYIVSELGQRLAAFDKLQQQTGIECIEMVGHGNMEREHFFVCASYSALVQAYAQSLSHLSGEQMRGIFENNAIEFYVKPRQALR